MARRGPGPDHHPAPPLDPDETPAGRGAPDLVLAERAAHGDQQAFDRLYRRHAPAAWRVAHAITGNPHDSADAVAEAFTRVLVALEAGRLEDGARFRSYLLSATRNASVDVTRRGARSRPTEAAEAFEAPSHGVGPSDRLVDRLDASLIAAAFRSLPERWRSVLWLTEVEGIPPREAAALLGMSANGVAQLAVRARAGLRERFLQAHLRTDVEDSCRFTVDHLGAYVGGGLAPREVAKVDQHLAACPSCAARKDQLEDLGPSLRRVIVPFPLGLAGLAAVRWKGALASARAARAAQAARSSTAAGAAGRAAARHRSVRLAGGMLRAHRSLLTMSLGLLALSIVGATIVGQQGPVQLPGRLAAPHSAAGPGELSIAVNPGGVPLTDAAALAPEAAGLAAGGASAAGASAPGASGAQVAGATLSAPASSTTTGTAAPATGGTGKATAGPAPVATSGGGTSGSPPPSLSGSSGSGGSPPSGNQPPSNPPSTGSGQGGGSGSQSPPTTQPSPPTTQPPPPLVQATASATVGPVSATGGAGAGSSPCNGASASLSGTSVPVGCPQPAPTGTGVTASTSGSLAPSTTVQVP